MMYEINMDDIGYFLFMENQEQEQKQTELERLRQAAEEQNEIIEPNSRRINQI